MPWAEWKFEIVAAAELKWHIIARITGGAENITDWPTHSLTGVGAIDKFPHYPVFLNGLRLLFLHHPWVILFFDTYNISIWCVISSKVCPFVTKRHKFKIWPFFFQPYLENKVAEQVIYDWLMKPVILSKFWIHQVFEGKPSS